MTIPLGHWIDRQFVCMDCLRDDDHREGGIAEGGWSALDQRVGSGKECSRCERVMPHLATVRLLPDGWSSTHAPKGIAGPGRKIIVLEREEQTLVEGHALVYVDVHGGGPSVGLCVKANGTVEVWVHDDPFGDGSEPIARWTYDRAPTPRPECKHG